MITKEDIDAMEERIRRIFPVVDVMTVNVLSYEMQHLRKLLDKPCAICTEIKETKKAEKVEKAEAPKKVKREQISKEDSVGSVAEGPQET